MSDTDSWHIESDQQRAYSTTTGWYVETLEAAAADTNKIIGGIIQ